MYFAIESAIEAGAQYIQLREKDLSTKELLGMAVRMRELTEKYGVKLFINDRVDVALSVKADGVHLGQSSMPAHAVRKLSADNLLIGVSAHSVREASDAEKDGANFITLGPIYKTPSKLRYGDPIGIEVLRETKSNVSIPVFAIGGIKHNMVRELTDAGADGVAIISAIFSTKNIKKTTEEFVRLLK
jgi:thiamine-phosphate pyrophosphorylase